MSFFKLAFILSLFMSGTALLLVFLFSQSEDQAMLSNKAGNFMPGSFDSVKNKVITGLVCVFCVSALGVASLENRLRNSSNLAIAIEEASRATEESAGNKEVNDSKVKKASTEKGGAKAKVDY